VPNANAAYPFSLKVSDNGLPSLSATQSFSISVNPLTMPQFSSIADGHGQISFQLAGETGPDYAVQISTNLVGWSTLLATNSPAMPWSWTDTNPASGRAQFYRIKTGPPLP
jgi:hypothetical protein